MVYMNTMKRVYTSQRKGPQQQRVKLESVDDEHIDQENKNWNLKESDNMVATSSDTSDIDTSDSEEDEDGVSAYERRRLNNLKDNAEFLSKLGMFQAKDNVKPKRKSLGFKVKKEPAPILPRRASLRLQNITPDGTVLEKRKKKIESEEIINRWDRKPPGPMAIDACIKNSTEKEGATFMSEVANLKPGRQSKSSVKDQWFAKMTINENRVAKVVPSRIFSIAVHPTEEKVLVCAGDKWGHVGLWDVETKQAGQDGVFVFQPHARPINCLRFVPNQPDRLISCSYDGTIRLIHFERHSFDEVYALEDEDVIVSSFDFLSRDVLLVTQGDGCVAMVDLRTNKPEAESIYKVHPKPVRCVSIHPEKKDYFVTASNDATVKLWDIRKLHPKKCHSLVSLPHGRYLNSAYFSPVTGNHVLTTSLDDTIRIYDSIEKGAAVDLKNGYTIRHNNHSGRWLTKIRATWHPVLEDYFVVGCMKQPRRIELFSKAAKLVHEFQGESLASVCSLNAFHPTQNILAGGNSSGRVHVFM